MSSKEEKQKIGLEELKITPPDDLGAGDELKTEEQEAIEAIRKFTDEDGDECGVDCHGPLGPIPFGLTRSGFKSWHLFRLLSLTLRS